MNTQGKAAPIEFSVVIPVHNGANYIASTLESVLHQTYPHFDVFVLENSSQDDTVAIVESYNEPRVQIIPSSEMLSIDQNWGRMVDLPLKPYLLLLCHDDPLYPEFLEEMVRLIHEEPNASIYHTHCHVIDVDGAILRPSFMVQYRETGDEFLRQFHIGNQDVIGSGYVMRSEDFKALGGLPPLHKLLYSDVLFIYLLAARTYKVCSPRFLYAYRSHPTGTGQSMKSLDMLIGGRVYLEALKATKHGQNDENLELARGLTRTFVFNRYDGYLFQQIYSHDKPNPQELRALSQQLEEASGDSGIFKKNWYTRALERAAVLHPPRLRIFVAYIIRRILTRLANDLFKRHNRRPCSDTFVLDSVVEAANVHLAALEVMSQKNQDQRLEIARKKTEQYIHGHYFFYLRYLIWCGSAKSLQKHETLIRQIRAVDRYNLLTETDYTQAMTHLLRIKSRTLRRLRYIFYRGINLGKHFVKLRLQAFAR